MKNAWVTEAKEWLGIASSEEMEDAAQTIDKYGSGHIIATASADAVALSINMEIMTDIQSYAGFDKLVDWILTDMAVGANDSEGPIPPDSEWLLKQGLDRGYVGEAMDCLKDIIAGNGYLYI